MARKSCSGRVNPSILGLGADALLPKLTYEQQNVDGDTGHPKCGQLGPF